ncbi:radical SAM/SPASM domain-containing protein [Chryseobacterium taichungense]|uniref:radical SAM/SPASM domain-containing protein n=1 Tax=Chryseobacterium taichungense TaxID=295069 RepID=UPI0028B130AF|nr:radical SAM protein [Chryseobacterium taichungense]
MENFLDKKLILNPYYSLRNDRKRILLCKSPSFKVPLDIAEDDIFVFIHPAFAIVFSFFDGVHTLRDCLNKISAIFNSSPEESFEFVKPFIENFSRVGIEYDGVFFEFPKNILLDNGDGKFQVREEMDYHELLIDEELDFFTNRLYEGPSTIRLLVNTVCATDCVYCYVDRRIKDNCKIPVERLIEIIHEAKKMKVVDFDIAGTEIFMYKHWDILIAELVKNGYYPYLSTKLPISEEAVIKLKTIGIHDLQLSIDTVDEGESLIINKIKKEGYIDQIFQTLSNLEKHGLNVAINVVLTKYNSTKEGISSLLNKINRYKNIERVTFNPAERSLGCSGNEFDIFKNQAFELDELRTFVYHLEAKMDFEIAFADYLDKSEFVADFDEKLKKHNSRAMCSANVSQLCILNDGQVTICEELYWNKQFLIGNVIGNTIEEVWKSDKALALANLSRNVFSDQSNCKTCRNFEDCRLTKGVCWSNVLMAYGEENWDYPSPNCPYSPTLIHSIHHD